MTASTRLNRALLAETLRKQHGVIGRPQTLTCGLTAQALQHRLRDDGPWQRILPGVYLAGPATPSADQRDMAALLYAGRGSLLTGSAALRRHGLRAPRTADIDVLVPASRRPQSIQFVRIRRTTRIPDLVCVTGQIRFAMTARAVADAVRQLSDLDVARAVVADAVQRDRCKVTELADELARGGIIGSGLLRRVLAEVADGVRSVAEADLRKLIIGAGLPLPIFNARLYAGTELIAIADAWWPEAAVAAEVDSREWHLSPADWERTLRRHARMTAEGILALHFTPRQIRTEPANVAEILRAALAAGRAGRQPRVRAVPAGT